MTKEQMKQRLLERAERCIIEHFGQENKNAQESGDIKKIREVLDRYFERREAVRNAPNAELELPDQLRYLFTEVFNLFEHDECHEMFPYYPDGETVELFYEGVSITELAKRHQVEIEDIEHVIREELCKLTEIRSTASRKILDLIGDAVEEIAIQNNISCTEVEESIIRILRS